MNYFNIHLTDGSMWQSDANQSLKDCLEVAAHKTYEQSAGISSIVLLTPTRDREITGYMLRIAKDFYDREVDSWANLEEDYIFRGVRP